MNLRDAIRNLFQATKPKELREEKQEALRTGQMFRHATYQKRGGKRHRPYTKTQNNGESKKRRQMAANSRKINRRA